MNQNELAVQIDRIIEQYKVADDTEGLSKQQALRALRYRAQFILLIEASNLTEYEKQIQVFIATKKMSLKHFWLLTKNDREVRAKNLDRHYPMMCHQEKECGSRHIRFMDTGLFVETIRNFHVITKNCAPRKSLPR